MTRAFANHATVLRGRAARTTVILALASLAVIANGTSGVLYSQTSLVPARHAVYDWLHRQRVLGRIDHVPFEARPISRGAIERYLRDIARHEQRLGWADRALLQAFLQEFSVDGLEAAAQDNWIRGTGPAHRRILRMFRDNAEPHLFAYSDSTIRYAIDILWSTGAMSGTDGGEAFSTALTERGFRAFADLFGHLGFHMEGGNLVALHDPDALHLDPVYNKTYQVVVLEKDNSLYHETHASARFGPLSVDLGHGALNYGVGRDKTLLVSRDAPTFGWFRFNLDTRYFRYTALHGNLAWDDVELVTRGEGAEAITSLRAPQRWIVLRRAEALPWRSFRFAISEMLLYSERPIDLAYLNPVTPVFFAEPDLGDRDNALVALDVMWRPVPGIELFGMILIDEVSKWADIVRLGQPGQHGLDLGIQAALPGGWDAEARYVRIDPWTWTHRRLNAVEQRGFPLAHPLGPNADAGSVRLRHWFPRRAFVAVGFEHQRKGLNPVDEEGRLLENVGGDITVESRLKLHFPLFHGADLQEFQTWTLEGRFEPWRGILIEALYRRDRIIRGGRVPALNYVDVRLKIGF